jgi:hypothetical protein
MNNIKTIIISLVFTFLVGCKHENTLSNDDRRTSIGKLGIVVVIDSCQYIVSSAGPFVYTHKGNCTNKIHYTK